MSDPQSIEERVRAEHPEFRLQVNDVVQVISPTTDVDRYEAMIAERVAWRTEREQELAEEGAETSRADAAKTRYQALKAGTATAAQTQQVVAHLLRQRYPDLAP